MKCQENKIMKHPKSLEDIFSRNSKMNEGNSYFLYKEKDGLIPLKDQNGYDSIGSIRNSRNTYDNGNYGGGENRPMTHKRSCERKITKVEGNHYDTSSYVRDREKQKSEKSGSIEPTETHNSTVLNQLSEQKVIISEEDNVMMDKDLSYNYNSLSEDFESASSSDNSRQNPLDINKERSSRIG
jgi:hypothetical protein